MKVFPKLTHIFKRLHRLLLNTKLLLIWFLSIGNVIKQHSDILSFLLTVEPWERSKLCNLTAEIIRPRTRFFSFSWNPEFSSACSLFYGIHQPFCILAGGLEASQSYNTEKEYEYIEAPSDNSHDDEPGILALSDLQVRCFSVTRPSSHGVPWKGFCSTVSELPKSGVKVLRSDICQRFTCSLVRFL